MNDMDEFRQRFQPRLALASMSGDSHAGWAEKRSKWVGAAFLGAFNLDRQTLSAAREMVARGRTEFLPDQPFEFLGAQLNEAKDLDCLVGANVRAGEPGLIHRAGERCVESDAVIEINAHCRQPEMARIHCGQQLLREPKRLRDYVQAAVESGAIVSVKGRFEVEETSSVDVLNRASEWGAHILHVDAMDSEPLVGELQAPFILANNGVREKKHVEEYQQFGADGVSVGRANNPEFLKTLSGIVDQLFTTDQEITEAQEIPPDEQIPHGTV